MHYKLKKTRVGTLRNPSENQSIRRKTSLYVGTLRIFFWAFFDTFWWTSFRFGVFREVSVKNRFLSGNLVWKSVFPENQMRKWFSSGKPILKMMFFSEISFWKFVFTLLFLYSELFFSVEHALTFLCWRCPTCWEEFWEFSGSSCGLYEGSRCNPPCFMLTEQLNVFWKDYF